MPNLRIDAFSDRTKAGNAVNRLGTTSVTAQLRTWTAGVAITLYLDEENNERVKVSPINSSMEVFDGPIQDFLDHLQIYIDNKE